jgi:hypothetical protein
MKWAAIFRLVVALLFDASRDEEFEPDLMLAREVVE